MKLLDKWGMSEWALNQCLDDNDTPEMRDLITDSWDAYRYCLSVKDRPEMWSKITKSFWAYYYCKKVKDRPEVRKFINEINR